MSEHSLGSRADLPVGACASNFWGSRGKELSITAQKETAKEIVQTISIDLEMFGFLFCFL